MNEKKKELATYFSIKYLATRGIQIHDDCYLHEGQYVTNDKGMFNGRIFERLGFEIFSTRAEAIVAAKEKIEKMIKASAAKTKKLERLKGELK